MLVGAALRVGAALVGDGFGATLVRAIGRTVAARVARSATWLGGGARSGAIEVRVGVGVGVGVGAGASVGISQRPTPAPESGAGITRAGPGGTTDVSVGHSASGQSFAAPSPMLPPTSTALSSISLT